MPDSLALPFGAVIVIFFAYERFNSAGYEGAQQFERLVAYLTPDKLRARRVILRAYLFYAACLVAIYLFLCTYAEVLPQLGGPDLTKDNIGASSIGAQEAPGAAPVDTAETRRGLDIEPSVALTIALIMVGLAPSFPILQRFEHWMRNTAHRLAGIPTRVIEMAETLRQNRFDFEVPEANPVPADTLLIRRGDWQRLAHYQRAGGSRLAAPEDFREDLEVIFAISTWILDHKLKLSGTQDRLRLQPLEAALRKRSEALIEALDEKSGYAQADRPPTDGTAAATPAAAAAPEAAARARGGWERLAREAEDLADDLCVLLALYLEHEIITPGAHTAAGLPVSLGAQANGKPHGSLHQHALAKAKLEEFLGLRGGGRGGPTVPQSHVVVTWLWTLGVVIVVSLAWSQWPGGLEAEMQRGSAGSGYSRALDYAFNAFGSYCIPMIVALSLRDGGLQARRWSNLWTAHWTRTLPQAVLLVVASWAVATLILIAAIFWLASFSPATQDPWAFLGFQFEYLAPATLRGAAFALIVMMLLDAQLVGARSLRLRPVWLSSLLWAAGSAAVMALIGGFARYMSAWAGARRAVPPRVELDAIDRGLIVYAALYAAIIAFLVVYCLAEALLSSRGGSRLGRSARAGGTAPVLPAE